MDNVARLQQDGLRNFVSGIGTERDKGTGTRFVATALTDVDLIAAYRGSWMARKIVDIIPEDMTREWRQWQADEGDITALEAEEDRLAVKDKLTDAVRWSRLLGGAAILIGTDGDPTEPLEAERLPQGGLKWLHVVDRSRLSPGLPEDDLADPNFGRPRSYLLTSANSQMWNFHHSRVVRFIGSGLPPAMAGDAWGDSVLQSLYDNLIAAATTSTVIASLLHEAKIDVIGVPNLTAHLSTEAGEQKLQQRFALAQMLKSFNHTLLLGDGETHTTKQIAFAGLPDVHRSLLLEVAGAADIPLTRLLGQSPAGMNATGESDMRMYYDKIASLQSDVLGPAFNQLDPLLQRSALGDNQPKGLYYEFNTLWQREPKEIAEINHKNAQAFMIDVQSGLFDDETLRRARANQIIETGAYPGFEQIEDETPNPE